MQRQSQAKAASAPNASFTPVQSGLLQRKCACGGTPGPTGECEACRKKREAAVLQRAAVSPGPIQSAPPIVHDVLRSPGQPLDTATRAFMESRFSHDFSSVRVHADTPAAESARAVNARAYTVGEDIVFGARQFMPTTHTGQRLLAHELAHVMQQGGSQTAMQHSSLAISKPDDAKEREADQIADVVMGSGAIANLQTDSGKSGGSVMLQRTIGDGHDLQSARFAGDPVLEACFDNERILQFGSRGPAVEKLQQALIDTGFPLPVFGVDGIFEAETQTAVRAFQRARELSLDGIVGPITMGALDAQFAAGPPAPTPPGPAPAPPGPAPASTQTLCFAVSELVSALTPGPRLFGSVAELIINFDYCKLMGCDPFLVPGSKGTDYFDNRLGAPFYIAFLGDHNKLSALQIAEIAVASLISLNRPDILSHKKDRKDYYEIKPNSISGRAAGRLKLRNLASFYAGLTLPYAQGTAYTPTPEVLLSSGHVGPFPLEIFLRVQRLQDGLVVYDLCARGELLNIGLATIILILIALIIIIIGGEVEIPIPIPIPSPELPPPSPIPSPVPIPVPQPVPVPA